MTGTAGSSGPRRPMEKVCRRGRCLEAAAAGNCSRRPALAHQRAASKPASAWFSIVQALERGVRVAACRTRHLHFGIRRAAVPDRTSMAHCPLSGRCLFSWASIAGWTRSLISDACLHRNELLCRSWLLPLWRGPLSRPVADQVGCPLSLHLLPARPWCAVRHLGGFRHRAGFRGGRRLAAHLVRVKSRRSTSLLPQMRQSDILRVDTLARRDARRQSPLRRSAGQGAERSCLL